MIKRFMFLCTRYLVVCPACVLLVCLAYATYTQISLSVVMYLLLYAAVSSTSCSLRHRCLSACLLDAWTGCTRVPAEGTRFSVAHEIMHAKLQNYHYLKKCSHRPKLPEKTYQVQLTYVVHQSVCDTAREIGKWGFIHFGSYFARKTRKRENSYSYRRDIISTAEQSLLLMKHEVIVSEFVAFKKTVRFMQTTITTAQPTLLQHFGSSVTTALFCI